VKAVTQLYIQTKKAPMPNTIISPSKSVDTPTKVKTAANQTASETQKDVEISAVK